MFVSCVACVCFFVYPCTVHVFMYVNVRASDPKPFERNPIYMNLKPLIFYVQIEKWERYKVMAHNDSLVELWTNRCRTFFFFVLRAEIFLRHSFDANIVSWLSS